MNIKVFGNGGASVGNVRPENVKRVAHELLKRYPDKFTSDFEENKKVVMSLVSVSSPKLRNSIVGYITRLASRSQHEEQP